MLPKSFHIVLARIKGKSALDDGPTVTASTQAASTLLNLPTEILLLIYDHFGVEDILVLRATCKSMRMAFQRPGLLHRYEAVVALRHIQRDQLARLVVEEAADPAQLESTLICHGCGARHPRDEFAVEELDRPERRCKRYTDHILVCSTTALTYHQLAVRARRIVARGLLEADSIDGHQRLGKGVCLERWGLSLHRRISPKMKGWMLYAHYNFGIKGCSYKPRSKPNYPVEVLQRLAAIYICPHIATDSAPFLKCFTSALEKGIDGEGHMSWWCNRSRGCCTFYSMNQLADTMALYVERDVGFLVDPIVRLMQDERWLAQVTTVLPEPALVPEDGNAVDARFHHCNL